MATGHLGNEEFKRTTSMVRTRQETKDQILELFEMAKSSNVTERQLMEKLFTVMPTVITMNPALQKTAHVDAFFEELADASMTDAQRRYPELLKVAANATGSVGRILPVGKDGPTGKVPVRSGLSGGSA